MIKRYLTHFVESDLKEKMVFIGGPRQVGKTTLARSLGETNYPGYSYLNWDNREDRKTIVGDVLPAGSPLLIFDELHKYRAWKNYIKGVYDTYQKQFAILVTGSARLDVYRRGGDSLFGRYHSYRLHPFSLREVLETAPKILPLPLKTLSFAKTSPRLRIVFDQLFSFGGFPEPFVSKNKKTLRRFHNDRLERLVKEDIRDIERIQDLSLLQILVELLPQKVGALLSIQSIQEDLGVAHQTVSHWLQVLERFYYHFRIAPYESTAIKSLRKQQKLYLWDWSQIENDDARLKNVVASHLLKFVHALYDVEGHKTDLFFLRDRDGHEVDFLVTVNRKPWFAVEVKNSGKFSAETALSYFGRKLRIPFLFHLVRPPHVDILKKDIRVMSVDTFLSGLV